MTSARGDSSTPEMVRRLRGGTDLLTAAAMRRLDAELPWYRALPAEDRSWIGLVAQSGIASFITWYENPGRGSYNAAEIFRAAPPELTRSISLQHTLQLVRIVVEIVEGHTEELAAPGQQAALREAVLLYSREVAFSAAEVYARAAESRGAWDARLEALVVDSLLRGDPDDSLHSRVAALGWAGRGSTLVMAGTAEETLDEVGAAELRRAARRTAQDALVGIQGNRLVVVLGGEGNLREQAHALLDRFGPGPVVIGPEVPELADAGRSARAALSALDAVRAWPSAPRPVLADELLPERVLTGDRDARRTLLAEVYTPLQAVGGPLLQTLSVYLNEGRSLEATARQLYVHPNTVRYRLRRIATVTGWDPVDAREGFVLQIAIAVGKLAEGVAL
ncbi:helix-turn-helix domain-containing protein [Ruania alkalisoli]|uniref:Helix-turn-helix domain-containing protein n=1 Tax=Ruania alkalisoli TaxID=2779775 RepID=A0A7M1SNQ2_9MICO|nr:helix-turn-helix domain-containing protein [Ruania alkalisoli]QOR69206.1 helix-turn-helix domain-containing protein [Ruania alkalisoli]